MKITPSMQDKHNKLLSEIKKEILEELKEDMSTATVAKQRIKEFVALGDLYVYINKYNPNSVGSMAYTQKNQKENISYNYFEDVLVPRLEKSRQENQELFTIKGIDLLEQGLLNSHLFQVFGVFQLAHFWGLSNSPFFQKISILDNNSHKYVCFITNNKANELEGYFNPDNDICKLSIPNRSIDKALGTTVHVFYRENEKDKLYYVSEYAILFDTERNPYSDDYTLVKIQKLSSLTSIQQLEQLKHLESLPLAENIKQERIASSYLRKSEEKAKVLKRANNICENIECSKNIPFIKSDDSTYLEVHHIIPISQQGADNEKNLIALCPNCHREAHYGKNKDLLQNYFTSIVKNKYIKTISN